METLNEYCLCHIFDFLTPLEWAQISQVCQLWRKLAMRQWKKVNEINFLNLKNLFSDKQVPKIPPEEVVKIMRYAGPYVKVLRLPGRTKYSKSFNHNFGKIQIGSWWCKSDSVLKTSYKWFSHDSIEELHLDVENLDVAELFEERFTNLKKLYLKTFYRNPDEASTVLKKIFSSLPDGLTTLHFIIFPTHVVSCNKYWYLNDILFHVMKRGQLEELVANAHDLVFTNWTFFADDLLKCFPKLRVLEFKDGVIAKRCVLSKLMEIPHLESLAVHNVNEYYPTKLVLPEAKNLKKFSIYFEKMTDNDFEVLSEAIKNMPKLLSFEWYNLSDEHVYMLACDLILWTELHEKDFVLALIHNSEYHRDDLIMKVTTKSPEDAATTSEEKILTFTTRVRFNRDEGMFDRLRVFIKQSLPHCNVITSRRPRIYNDWDVFY